MSRDEQAVRWMANPMEAREESATMAAHVQTTRAEDIDETIESTLSMMPAGLLHTLTREEILDLLLFVESGADPSHAAFAKP